MVDKMDGTIVIHVPKDLELAFMRIAELKGFKKSEYGRQVVEREVESFRREFERLREIFQSNHEN